MKANATMKSQFDSVRILTSDYALRGVLHFKNMQASPNQRGFFYSYSPR